MGEDDEFWCGSRKIHQSRVRSLCISGNYRECEIYNIKTFGRRKSSETMYEDSRSEDRGLSGSEFPQGFGL